MTRLAQTFPRGLGADPGLPARSSLSQVCVVIGNGSLPGDPRLIVLLSFRGSSNEMRSSSPPSKKVIDKGDKFSPLIICELFCY